MEHNLLLWRHTNIREHTKKIEKENNHGHKCDSDHRE